MIPLSVLLRIVLLCCVSGYVNVNNEFVQHAYELNLAYGDELTICGRVKDDIEISLSDVKPWLGEVSTSVKVFLNDGFTYAAYRTLRANFSYNYKEGDPVETEKRIQNRFNMSYQRDGKFCVDIEAYEDTTGYPYFHKIAGFTFFYPFAQQLLSHDVHTQPYYRSPSHLKFLMIQGARTVTATLNGDPLPQLSTLNIASYHLTYRVDYRSRGGLALRDPLELCFQNLTNRLELIHIRLLPQSPKLWEKRVYLLVRIDVQRFRYYADFTVGDTGLFSSAIEESKGGQRQIQITHLYQNQFCVKLQIDNSAILTEIGAPGQLIRQHDLPFTELEPIRYMMIDGVSTKDIMHIKDVRGKLFPLPEVQRIESIVYRLDDRGGKALRDPVELCFKNMVRRKRKIFVRMLPGLPAEWQELIFLMATIDVRNKKYYADFTVGDTGIFSMETAEHAGGNRQVDIHHEYHDEFCMHFTIRNDILHVDIGEPPFMSGDPNYPANELLPYKFLKIDGIVSDDIVYIKDKRGPLTLVPLKYNSGDYEEPE